MAQDGTARVIEEISAERERQKSSEGWTAKHDDTHVSGELALAAACYAAASADTLIYERYVGVGSLTFSDAWPWDRDSDKRGKHEPRRILIMAAALIVAEIERLDRQSADSAP